MLVADLCKRDSISSNNNSSNSCSSSCSDSSEDEDLIVIGR